MTSLVSDAYAAWRQSVAGVLAKTGRIDPAETVAEPERLLDTSTYDGLTIAPLYTPAGELPEDPLPGQAPFVRGAVPASGAGWGVCARYGEDGDAAAANTLIRDDLDNGVTSVWLTVDDAGVDGVPPADVAAALESVILDLAPVRLDPGAAFTGAADALLAHLDAAVVDDPAQVRLALGADPWTLRIRNGAPADGARIEDAVALALRVADRRERISTLTVDGTVFHDAGAGDAEELGACLAAGVSYVRALVDGGLDVADALRAIEFRYAVTDDQFAGIAKLRAARTAWARVAEVAGAQGSGAPVQHAVTSAAMMAQRDPWVNMLRTTLAAFAAGVGGATEVTVLPFDHALAGSAPGVSKRFAARIARNTQLLLLEESHTGRVADPAGGSWYVERYTRDLSDRAWQFFQQIEREGGFGPALEAGVVAERIAATRTARADDVARRRTRLTGVNEFPMLDEPPATGAAPTSDAGLLPVVRYAQQFEAMRDRSDRHLATTGARPRAHLVTLGSLAEHNQRATYAKNLLAGAGVEVTTSGPLEDPAAVASALGDAAGGVAVLCGPDARYGTLGAAAVAALRAGGATRIYAIGPGDAFAATDDVPDEYLAPGADVVAALTRVLDLLEES